MIFLIGAGGADHWWGFNCRLSLLSVGCFLLPGLWEALHCQIYFSWWTGAWVFVDSHFSNCLLTSIKHVLVYLPSALSTLAHSLQFLPSKASLSIASFSPAFFFSMLSHSCASLATDWSHFRLSIFASPAFNSPSLLKLSKFSGYLLPAACVHSCHMNSDHHNPIFKTKQKLVDLELVAFGVARSSSARFISFWWYFPSVRNQLFLGRS